jgi:uncharacterized membrane protein YkvA (DUF1232 family)
MKFSTKWRQWARQLKTETYTLYLAYRDPRMPWYARLLAVVVVGYAFSPIDLIPDFIPVLGYLDDVVLIPVGVALTIKLIPSNVLSECRQQARATIAQNKPTHWTAAVVIVIIWIVLAVVAVLFVAKILNFEVIWRIQ